MNPTPTPVDPRGADHLNYLDGLRGLAALYVVLHHGMLQQWPGTPPKGLTWLAYGHFSVVVFIVLSGFCLALPVVRGDGRLRGGITEFFKRRAWRILPTYYAALAVSLLLVWTLIGRKTGTHWDTSLPVTRDGILSHILMVQEFRTPTQINHALWSISLELHIYLVFPLIIFARRKMGGLAAIGIAAPALYFCWRALGSHKPIYWWFYAIFAVGVLAADIAFSQARNSQWLRRKLPFWTLALAGLALSIVWCSRLSPDANLYDFFQRADFVVTAVAFAGLVSASLPGGNALRSILSIKPLVHLGRFSYSLYLLHAPLLQVIWQYAIVPLKQSPIISFLLLAVVGTPAIIGISYLFFLAFERPFIPRKKNPNDQIPNPNQIPMTNVQ